MVYAHDPLPGERPAPGDALYHRPSIAHRLVRSLVDHAAADIGVPLQLHRAATAAAIVSPNILAKPSGGIDACKIIRWDRWHRRSLPSARHSPWPVRSAANALRWSGRRPNIVSCEIEIEALTRLCRRETIEDFRCDARDIECLCASKAPLAELGSLDEMATRFSANLIDGITLANLRRNLAHEAWRGPFRDEGVVLDRFGWDGRLCLHNEGGSHHFAAARYLASRLGTPLPIRATLNEYRFDADAVEELDVTYRLFLIGDVGMARLAIGDALRNFSATFLLAAAPRPHQGHTVLLLPRSHGRSCRAAKVMDRRGHFDFGRFLTVESRRERSEGEGAGKSRS